LVTAKRRRGAVSANCCNARMLGDRADRVLVTTFLRWLQSVPWRSAKLLDASATRRSLSHPTPSPSTPCWRPGSGHSPTLSLGRRTSPKARRMHGQGGKPNDAVEARLEATLPCRRRPAARATMAARRAHRRLSPDAVRVRRGSGEPAYQQRGGLGLASTSHQPQDL
jgi:hypothetical protein